MRRLAAFILSTITLFAHAQTQVPSPSMQAPPNARLLFTAKGEGVQIYTCANGKWLFKAPSARLLDGAGKQIGTHFAGPTWRLNDGGEVKGKAVASQPSPEAGSVPWLLIEAVPGSAKGSLAAVAYIRRSDTHGGAPPAQPCKEHTLSMPYRATYSFYSQP